MNKVHTSLFLALLIGLVPLTGVLFPRALAFLPAVAGLVGCLVISSREKTWPSFDYTYLLIAVVSLALASLSAFWSINAETSLDRVQKMAIVLLPGILWVSFLQKQGKEWGVSLVGFDGARLILPGVLLAAALICTVDMMSGGMVYHLSHDPDPTNEFNLSHLNRAVVIIILASFVGFAFLRESVARLNAGVRVVLYVCVAMVFAALLFVTHSQSAHLALGVGIGFYLFFPVRMKAAWVALGGGLSLLLIVTPWMTQALFDFIPAMVEDMGWFTSSYAPQRLEIWDYVSRHALERPWIGHGIEATKAVEHFDTAQIYQDGDTILHPHNFAVQIWMEFGALGVAACIAFFACMLKMISQMSLQGSKIALASFMAFLSVASTGYGLWQSWWLGLMIMVAGFVVLYEKSQDNAVRPAS